MTLTEGNPKINTMAKLQAVILMLLWSVNGLICTVLQTFELLPKSGSIHGGELRESLASQITKIQIKVTRVSAYTKATTYPLWSTRHY